MYDSWKVIIGIIVFILIFTAPVWLNLSNGEAAVAKPNPELPSNYSACIMDKDFMKANHMDVLNQWRDSVVRMDTRYYKMGNGKYFMLDGQKAEMSLTKTCMKCHVSKVKFCDECHNYMDVVPYCWNCHIEPKEVKP